MLVVQFVFRPLQPISEFDWTHYTYTFFFLHIVLFVCCFFPPLLLLVVARIHYQINAGSYLVTLSISCGPALPCGCCSRDDRDGEKGEGGGGGAFMGRGTTLLLLRQKSAWLHGFDLLAYLD